MSIRRRIFLVLVSIGLLASACAGSSESGGSAGSDADTSTTSQTPRPASDLVDSTGRDFITAPKIATGEVSSETREQLDTLFADLRTGVDNEALSAIGNSDDVRLAWLLTDLMRFTQTQIGDPISTAFTKLTGMSFTAGGGSSWKQATDALIAWDVPAPPDYVTWKRIPFELVEPAWTPFFDDENSAVDWRIYSWGGVLIDDRPRSEADTGCPRGCIPALNDPTLTDAAGGDWYSDDSIIFGIEVNGEAVAFPKNLMEVHEMVNTTIGGRRLGIPY